MADEAYYEELREGLREPWPQYERTEPISDYPVQSFGNLGSLTEALKVAPVEVDAPVTNPESIDNNAVRELFAKHLSSSPLFTEDWRHASPFHRLVTIFHAHRFRAVLQAKAASLDLVSGLTTAQLNSWARCSGDIDNQKSNLLILWREELQLLDDASKELLAEALKRQAGAWKHWAKI